MGLWDLFKKKPAPAPAPAKAPARAAPEPPAVPEAIARLARAGLPGGPTDDESVRELAALRSTPDEARAVEELARASQLRRLPEGLLLALAAALLDRGEPEGAGRVLAHATSSPALVMLADLAERRGDLTSALSLVERVLLRDLDHPGARERHRRFRAELGFVLEQKAVAPGATVMAREPDAPFNLLREVGRGGAAAVYEGVDRELGRHVALKVYHQPERDRAQLAHEARVAVALEGRGIIRVFDVDPERGWIALAWAPAGALRDRIRDRDPARLSPLERWARSLAAALARVHAAGWVHNDVKPANVLLSRSGEAILTDFGSARRVGEPSPPGSLGYVSPERMQGRASDPREDVYGFGRVIEDALEIVSGDDVMARYGPLARACTGPEQGRPADARALLAHLEAALR